MPLAESLHLATSLPVAVCRYLGPVVILSVIVVAVFARLESIARAGR